MLLGELLVHPIEQLAAILCVKRAHITRSNEQDDHAQHMYEPRYLLFEFTTGFVPASLGFPSCARLPPTTATEEFRTRYKVTT